MPKFAGDRADRHQAPVRAQLGEERRQLRTGDDVDDDVVGVRRPLAGPIQHAGRAELAQAIAAVARRRRDRDRARPGPGRQLDRHDPDAARRAADQHRLTRGEVGVAEAEVGHGAGAAERHRVDGGRRRRKRDERLGRGDRQLGVTATHAGEGPHPLSGPLRVDARPGRGHRARDLAAEDVPVPEPVRGEGAAADHGVDPAHADRLGGDQHLPFGGFRDREVDDRQPLGAAERLHRNCFHASDGSGRRRPLG